MVADGAVATAQRSCYGVDLDLDWVAGASAAPGPIADQMTGLIDSDRSTFTGYSVSR
jgi:hypothetical protein